MASARPFGPLLALPLLLSGCDLLGGSPDPAALVVSVTGVPAGTTARWEITGLDGRPVSSGELVPGVSDTVELDGSRGYFVRYSPFSAMMDGVAFHWSVPDPVVEVGPLGAGEEREVIGAYAQVAGALRLRPGVGWEAQVSALATPIPPTPGSARGSGFFSTTGERLLTELPFGDYAVAWTALARPMGTQGRFGNTWSHVYRAPTDTVTVGPVPAPAIDSARYALTSGAFRVSYTGLPPDLLVGFGFTRTDGAVSIGATFSTTPGLEAVVVTEWLGDYRYSSVDVTSGGVTYRAAPSPTYTLAAELTPVEVVIAYAPLP